MNISLLFWILMLLWLVLGVWRQRSDWQNWIVPFLAVLALGWIVLGAPVKT